MRVLIINGSREIHHVMVPPIGGKMIVQIPLIIQWDEISLLKGNLKSIFQKKLNKKI
ncbi:MAG: hypothetical protein ACFFFB_00380 [Candidatus Heimdallarchaeota archaeon]